MWPDLGAIRDGIIFNLLHMIGGILWTLDRIMMMVAAVLHWFRVLLVGGGGQDNLLGVLMTQLLQGNELLKQLVYLGIMFAFTILAFTLLARPIIGPFQAVEFNRVILWFSIAVIIFSAGPGMVAGLESTRLGLQEQAHLIASTIQYQNEVNRYNNQVVPNTVGDFWLPGQTPGYVPHLFGTGVGSDCSSGCNGLDAAAAFLGAEEGDITGERAQAQNTGGYPQALYDRYFVWREGNEEERSASVRNAKDGVMRLLQGTLPAFFAIVEAVIFLLFAVAAMVLFISLPVAIPFAFFSLTEIIATSVLRAYLFLVVRTFVAATMLAFLVQMLIIFAQRGTAMVFIAISALTMLLSFQFVRMAASTVTGALNVIGSAVGSATGIGVRQTDPYAAAGRVAGMAALAGAAVATGGGALVGAATLLHRQGGLRGGGLSAVGSAALHAARVRAGAAVGRSPLAGLQRGYSAVHAHHQLSRERAYQLEAASALLLDRDAEEAAAVLMEQRSVTPVRKEWAAEKVREWTSVEESRQKYRQDMRHAGLGRLAGRGYSRPWKVLNAPNGTHGGTGGNRAVPAPTGEVSPASDSRGPSAPPAQPNSTISGPGTPGKAEHPASTAVAPPTASQAGSTTGSTTGSTIASSSPATPAAPAAPAANATEGSGGLPGVGRSASAPGAAGSEGLPSWPAGGGTANVISVAGGSAAAHDPTTSPIISAILPFKPSDASLRAAVDDALLMENTAIGLIGGYLVVYSGARSEDDPRPGRYELTPDTSDILDLLQKGKHAQRSREHPGYLMAWEPDPARFPVGLPALAMWSGTDAAARRQVLSDARDLADTVRQGLPLNTGALQGKLGHLSVSDRQRLVGMLQAGTLSPDGMIRVLEAASDVAESIEAAGSEAERQALLAELLGEHGYVDLSSQGVASVMSQVASRGGNVEIERPAGTSGSEPIQGNQRKQRKQRKQGSQGIAPADMAPADMAPADMAPADMAPADMAPADMAPADMAPADMALLLGAGLGLKRALPWPQVKGAIVRAARSDAPDTAQAVAESLGVPSLRTSMAPIKRFVETARGMGLQAYDVSSALDVATAARDIGEVIAATSEKDEAARRARWGAAGVPQRMHQPLDSVRSHALQHVARLSPVGAPEHRIHEKAAELLGTLLAEGAMISNELHSVPIESYSDHPFTAGMPQADPRPTGTPDPAGQPTNGPTPSPADKAHENTDTPGGANETT